MNASLRLCGCACQRHVRETRGRRLSPPPPSPPLAHPSHTMLRRPSTLDEGVEQLRAAVGATAPSDPSADHPRARLWGACNAMLREDFVAGMRLLYDANAIVSFLFNTIVPHVEERMRFDTLSEEMDAVKPESAAQNEARMAAIVKRMAEADAVSRAKMVDSDFETMRQGVSALYMDVTVVRGLTTLYVSSKKARGVLDLIFQRLDEALRNDASIKSTTDIPMEAMLLR